MAAARPNLFELLELDPTVTDPAALERALKSKTAEWSMWKTQGTTKQRRHAPRYLGMLDDLRRIIADPARLAEESREARKAQVEREAIAFKKLDALLDLITDPSRPLSPADLKAIIKKVPELPEQAVRDRLAQRGLRVEAPAPRRTARPTLDSVIAKQIQTNLDVLGLADLYELLGLKRQSSVAALRKAADELGKAMGRSGKTDPETTTRSALSGQGIIVFASDDQKDRYDATLDVQRLEGLKDQVDFAGRDGLIELDEMDKLIVSARGLGVEAEEARAWILDYAQRKRYSVQRGAMPPSASLPQCGFCGALGATELATRCTGCGELFKQPCPRCSTPTPTDQRACAKCGTNTGDAPQVKDLMRAGQERAATGDVPGAVSLFERALVIWPGWADAVKAKKAVESRGKRLESALRSIETLVRDARLEEARRALQTFVAENGTSATASSQSQRIEQGLKAAAVAFKQAEQLRASKKLDDALARYEQALGYCADYAPVTRALAGWPPPPPPSVAGRMVGSSVQLQWTAPQGASRLGYRVVCKEGGAPSRPDDGEVLSESAATRYDHAAAQSGVPLFYAVWSVRLGTVSATAAVTGPHLRTADPRRVVVEPGNGEVSLRWKRPPGAARVAVTRKQGGQPRDLGDGAQLKPSGGSLHDTGLENRRTYGYLLVAVYPDPSGSGREFRSPGVRVEAMPIAPPPTVTDLAVTREDRTVMLSWTPPAGANVQLRRSDSAPSLTPGRMLPISDGDTLGAPVATSGPGRAQTTLPGNGCFWFVPLTVAGPTAVVGQPVAVTTQDDVSDFEARTLGEQIVLTWSWPAGAGEVLVLRSDRAYPAFPDDPAATRYDVTRAAYERSGCWELNKLARSRHYFTVFVKEQQSGLYSTGARGIAVLGKGVQVPYRVVVKKSGLFKKSVSQAWVELTGDDGLELRGLMVVCKPNQAPLRPSDGKVLATVTSLVLAGGEARIEIPPKHLRGSGYIKLFFDNPDDAKEVRLMPAKRVDLFLG